VTAQRSLAIGLLCALGAGCLWGLVFIAPAALPDYPATLLSFGRYLAFGLIALPLALHARAALRALTRADWARAFELALTGNIIYYCFLAAAIQIASPPLPTMMIGSLPVVIAVCSNLFTSGPEERRMPWRKLAPSLLLIAAGIALVNRDEAARLMSSNAGSALSSNALAAGALLALGAVAAWTVYPIRNASWLKQRPSIASFTWATAQGLASLPLALVGYVAVIVFFTPSGFGSSASVAAWLGPRPLVFLAWMFVIAFFASWLGTLLWNRASQLLPTALTGQLIVFETLAALAMGYAWRGAWPPLWSAVGIACLVAGVVVGVRAFQPPAQAASSG
jgi:drug/metabolite transporter (DMT)-like permease